MNILVIGYGSIGQRHARLYKQLGCSVGVVTRRLRTITSLDFVGFETLESAIRARMWDIVVVANKTSEHHQTLEQLRDLYFSGDVLVEKPIFDTPTILSGLDESRIFVAYNLRFHPLIQKIHQLLQSQRILSVQMYVGQYLPTWRPGRDYTENYSISRDEGGGVIRDLSHEIDLMQYLFGSWRRLTAIGGKYSHLEGDSDDLFSLLVETDRCPMVNVHMNYMDRIFQRSIVINTDDFTVKVDLAKGTFQVNQEEVIYVQLERDETYLAQHTAVMNRDYRILCSYGEGLNVVRIIDAAKKAAIEGKWIVCE